MAKTTLDISQFKSAGVYTLEIDNTERISVTTQSLRLVPGFSMNGPFNAPVFIRSTKDLEKFYGTNDVKLERKGSFFNRAITTCLQTAPVFAINLLKVDTTPTSKDVVDFVTLSLDSSVNNGATIGSPSPISPVKNDLFSNFFNRERFWTADPDYLQGVAVNKLGVGDIYNAPFIQLANVSTKNISFIVRKASTIQQYNVYAKDWFGSAGNIPYEWIRPYDLIKDFFIQVIAIEGDWSNYTSLAVDPYWSTYFSVNGLKVDQMTNFMNASQISMVGSWTGCIIPDFKDKTGAEQYVETIVNASTPLTGVLMNINQQALDQLQWGATSWELGNDTSLGNSFYQIDLTGHNLSSFTGANITKKFLSYNIDVSTNVLKSSLVITNVINAGKTFTIDPSSNHQLITVGSLVKSNNVIQPSLTYVINKYYDSSVYICETAEPILNGIGATTVSVQKPIDDPSICSSYDFIVLNGLKLTNRHLPGFTTTGAVSAEEGVKKIYGMLLDSGILRGLLNPDMIQYRYIVDTMAYGLQSEMGGKAYLSSLAKKRGKTTALINAPALSQFATSQNPYFCDTFISGVDPVPIFNTAWIATGGNPDMPRSFRFSLPSEENGSKYCGVFGPFLKYNDSGKLISVPPAADVSNSYIQKFIGGDPYAVIANKTGIIGNANVAGVEYMLDKIDRDSLEPIGYNSIIEKPKSGQTMIYSNATAFQTVKSDYNNLHVRELLNTIELQVDEILQQYVFDYNNELTRINIYNSVAPILQTIKDSGALTKYEIIMDETNNTADLIADGIGIIDINVWITGPLTKIVNRISVNRTTNERSSGGFAAV